MNSIRSDYFQEYIPIQEKQVILEKKLGGGRISGLLKKVVWKIKIIPGKAAHVKYMSVG